MKRLLPKILLIGFFLFSLFLHFYKIDTAPKAALVDGAALGYNAYSISQTGKDEFGTPHPLLFKSFGDQKLPLYIYASVLPVKIFGLNLLSIKFVAAFSASLFVIVMFLILTTLGFSETVSLVGAGITTVSAWTFVLGRFSLESSLGLLLFSLSLLFLLKSMKKNSTVLYILGAFFLGLTWYSYIPYRIIALFTFGIFLLISKTQFSKKVIYMVIFLLLIAPSLAALVSPSGSARFKQTTILYDQVNALRVDEKRLFCNEFYHNPLCSLIINKPVEIGETALKTLTRILSVNYIFISSETDGQLINVGYFALLPIFMAPFYLLGFIFLYTKRKELQRNRQFVFLGITFLACLLPILITKSPVRIQMSSLFPFILILIILGYDLLLGKTKRMTWHMLALLLLSLYGGVLLFYFINVHAARNYANEKFLANASIYLGQHYNDVPHIYVDPAYADFITFYAFYNRVDPTFYQKNIIVSPPDSGGFQHSIALGKIQLTHENYGMLACIAKKNKEKDFFVINHDISREVDMPIRPIFTGQEPDQLVYGYIYNLADLCPNQ